jgi:hypothetical protein
MTRAVDAVEHVEDWSSTLAAISIVQVPLDNADEVVVGIPACSASRH